MGCGCVCRGALVHPVAGRLKWPILALCLLWKVAAAQPAGPQLLETRPVQPATPSAAPLYSFNIAEQPLAAALEQYGELSGRPVFFDSSLVAGRTSTAVQGIYAPEAALRKLLDGTGLTLDYGATGQAEAFVLRAADPMPAAPLPDNSADTQNYRDYDGLLQTRIWQAFCESPLAGPGDYRTALRFSIDAAGRIIEARLLHSTGERDRDSAVLTILQTIQLDEPPPPEMAQPIYMVILPRGAIPGVECRSRP